ncbi:MAG: flavodoxin family protein [Paramuribaculum sp.]|nr:flavodoxin family protein [Paramuribaculum sp.]
MKIVVLKGSPRINGNSNLLAGEFIKGATEAGHEIIEFDCTRHKVGGCMACERCNMAGPCVQKDDFELIRPHLIDCDAILFATPIYYFGPSAQLKAVIDRFYAIHGLMGPKKTLLFTTMVNPNPGVAEPTIIMFDKMNAYLGWKDCGRIIANGIFGTGEVRNTPFMEHAYELGKHLN